MSHTCEMKEAKFLSDVNELVTSSYTSLGENYNHCHLVLLSLHISRLIIQHVTCTTCMCLFVNNAASFHEFTVPPTRHREVLATLPRVQRVARLLPSTPVQLSTDVISNEMLTRVWYGRIESTIFF